MRLIIIRHGETLENKEGIIMGHLPGTLSDLGVEQAKKVAQRLKDEDIDYIFSSDLDRAADTTKEIAKFHNLSPEFVEEIREMGYGKLQGKKKPSNWGKKKFNHKFQEDMGMEGSVRVLGRAKKFLEGINKKYGDKNILLVGHDTINRALISAILNKSTEDIDEIGPQHNTSVSIIEIKDGLEPIIHLINDIKHLEE